MKFTADRKSFDHMLKELVRISKATNVPGSQFTDLVTLVTEQDVVYLIVGSQISFVVQSLAGEDVTIEDEGEASVSLSSLQKMVAAGMGDVVTLSAAKMLSIASDKLKTRLGLREDSFPVAAIFGAIESGVLGAFHLLTEELSAVIEATIPLSDTALNTVTIQSDGDRVFVSSEFETGAAEMEMYTLENDNLEQTVYLNAALLREYLRTAGEEITIWVADTQHKHIILHPSGDSHWVGVISQISIRVT